MGITSSSLASSLLPNTNSAPDMAVLTLDKSCVALDSISSNEGVDLSHTSHIALQPNFLLLVVVSENLKLLFLLDPSLFHLQSKNRPIDTAKGRFIKLLYHYWLAVSTNMDYITSAF